MRALRVSAGLTQTDLAGDRFSKEYISQIERGKTRPTPETIGWLASRLGVDATFLASGVSSDQRARTEAILTRAEAQTERRDFAAAVEEYTEARRLALAAFADPRQHIPSDEVLAAEWEHRVDPRFAAWIEQVHQYRRLESVRSER